MIRYRVLVPVLFVAVLAIALGWLIERRRLVDHIEKQDPPINLYGEKFAYWSPCLYLGSRDTSYYESLLSERIEFNGKIVVSSQGMGSRSLRQPTLETLDATFSLLDDDNESNKLQATELLALYLQAVSGSKNLDSDSKTTRVHFHSAGLRKTRELLESDNSKLRSAAALILGNTLYDQNTVQLLSDAFDRETDATVKWHVAWAYWRNRHNDNRAEFIRGDTIEVDAK